MAKNLTTLLLCLLTIVCYSQKKPEKYIVPDLLMQIECGYVGRTDEVISDYANYVYKREFKTLREKLNSSDLYSQLLSAICLSEMETQGKVVLTDAEKEAISQIKTSQKLYAVCNGDVSTNSSPISELFRGDTPSAHLKLIKNKLGLLSEE